MPELIDVLDENGNKTGKVATRYDIHKEGLWHRSIVAAILNEKNEILLQQRSYNKKKNPGIWDISVAGHIDAGESALSATMRETAEELGINRGGGANFRYLTSYREISTYDWNGKKMTDRQFFDCFITKIAKIQPSKITFQTEEVQAVKLVDIAEFERMVREKRLVDRQVFYDAIINYILHNKATSYSV